MCPMPMTYTLSFFFFFVCVCIFCMYKCIMLWKEEQQSRLNGPVLLPVKFSSFSSYRTAILIYHKHEYRPLRSNISRLYRPSSPHLIQNTSNKKHWKLIYSKIFLRTSSNSYYSYTPSIPIYMCILFF